jgi:WD40 repeat protein
MFAKAFRLFVSSTFQDFGEERRLLQEQVFPALEAHCAAQGFGFRAIDMRWGVNDDAQLNQRTAEICLGEVIEAKGYPAPNLLILIGDRYGWVPLPFAIARDEFEAARSWLIAQGQSDAVVDLGRVYALDENHLVPGGLTRASAGLIGAYTLRSRQDDLIDLKAPEVWVPVEARLRDALQAAARHLHANGQLRDAELEKYTLSLTEQEIRNGLEQIAASDGPAAANSIAWLRTTEAGEPPVRTLADAVRRALPGGSVLRAELQAESETYGQHFVDQIKARLIAAIDAQIADIHARQQAPDFAVQTERAIHATFAAERLHVFVGRESNLAAIAAHIASDARHPLALTGISGSGKTALMARAAADTRGAVVQRFVGASAASTNQRNLLISVIDDLAALGVASTPAQWDDDDNRFVNQVRDLLAALDQPVAIFIDALDQLPAPYRPMWLPPQLNANVKLTVSVLDDEAFPAERGIVQGLRRSLPTEAFLAMEPLSKKDGADILAGLMQGAQRGLTIDQQAFIRERFRNAGASPLYLRIAFAIARRWRSTDKPETRGLADDVTALIGQFLDELSKVHYHEPLLVRRALGLIAAGREGLSESESIAVLSRDAEVMAAISSERFGARSKLLPDSVWVRLKRSLAALLVEKGVEGEPLIGFFHRQVAEVVRARLYDPEGVALHAALAEYFDPPAKDGEAEPAFSRRSLAELPFQLFHAQNRDRLDALLTDPAWIDRKIEAFAGVAEIVADYESFADPTDALQPLIGKTFRLASGIITRDPEQWAVQLHGRLLGLGLGPQHDQFLASLVARTAAGGLIETRPALMPPGAELARLEDRWVMAIAVLPDGRLVSAGGNVMRVWDTSGSELARLKANERSIFALAVLPDGCLASAGDDIQLWDVQNGRALPRFLRQKGSARALAVLPNDRMATTDGKTIRLWGVSSGLPEGSFEGHLGRVSALAALPDGRLASGGRHTIRLWDIAAKRETACLDAGHRIFAFAVLPDGRLASACGDGAIRLWDTKSGRELARLKSHEGPVAALAVLRDGRLASGGTDGVIRLWDVDDGREVGRLVGHSDPVRALAVLPDGRLVSGSLEGGVRFWNTAAKPDPVRRPAGHEGSIDALAVLPNHRLASAGADNMVRFWDALSGREISSLKAYQPQALAALSDQRLAIGTGDGMIVVVASESGGELSSFEAHSQEVKALAALNDGRLASTGGMIDDNIIRVWDAASGVERVRLEGHTRWVGALAVFPDGRLASGGVDKIRVWDVAEAREFACLEDGGTVLAIFADGRLASGHSDGAIKVWDATSGAVLAHIDGEGEKDTPLSSWISVTAAAALSDGRLAIGTEDGSIRLWDPAGRRALVALEIDGPARAMVVLEDGRLVIGDGLGCLHWLTIKATR